MARWSGKHASIAIGTYPIGDLENWTLEATLATVDVTAVDDISIQRIATHADWKVTARKFTSADWPKLIGYMQEAGGQGQLKPSVEGATFEPLMVSCESPDGSGNTIFACLMFMTSARWDNPHGGAVAEDVTFEAAGNPTAVPNL